MKWNNRGKWSIVWRCVSRLTKSGTECASRTVGEANRNGVRQRIEEMEVLLNEQAGRDVRYDDQLVRKLVERVTVFEDGFVVEFKSGMKVEV